MTYITKDKALTINGKTWWVNSQKSGLFKPMLVSMIYQLDVMLTHHSKVHVLRFDLRLYKYTDDNKIIEVFLRRLKKWLKRKYELKRVGYAWARELETAKNQHYHFALFLNGHKINYPQELIKKILAIASQIDTSAFIPDNCYYNIKRGDYESIQAAIWRLSYLAKARGKGYKAKQTKNYGTSKLLPQTSLKV
ncbi:inovirus-type Gp2 protein [Thalassotalea sp. PS06]|uniref:YagK/YfjJ domain-containing protein n=1 Tax=Thalassotalea sp. PS06 TaxID=2594005 RepID=UPI0011622EE0|nr:inovirus-type Gp2 protein [Thalassotalea sp. PS06]QDP01813.1 inovirus Gp2 family protein [Thalassotalea sp. PS06]